MTKPNGTTPDVAHLMRSVTVMDVLARYGLAGTLKGSGNRLRGPCPIHRGSGQEFHVNLAKNTWICFSPKCHRGGSSLRLVSMKEGVSTQEAAALLMSWFHPPRSPVKGEYACLVVPVVRLPSKFSRQLIAK